jgi:hypothetical protein
MEKDMKKNTNNTSINDTNTRTCPRCGGDGVYKHHTTITRLETKAFGGEMHKVHNPWCFLCDGKGTITDDADGQVVIPEHQYMDALYILAMAVGECEPLLHDSDPSPSLYEGCEQGLNELIEVQEEMAILMAEINSYSVEDRVRVEYHARKNQFNRAKDIMFKDKSRKPQTWWDRFNFLKNQRDEAWAKYEKAYSVYQANSELVSDLWDQWHALLAESKEIAAQDKKIWPAYFRLVDGTEGEYYNPLANKQVCPELDDRMLCTDEAYFQAYMEETEADALYNWPTSQLSSLKPCTIPEGTVAEEESDEIELPCSCDECLIS